MACRSGCKSSGGETPTSTCWRRARRSSGFGHGTTVINCAGRDHSGCGGHEAAGPRRATRTPKWSGPAMIAGFQVMDASPGARFRTATPHTNLDALAARGERPRLWAPINYPLVLTPVVAISAVTTLSTLGGGRAAIGICVDDDASRATDIPSLSTIRTRSAVDRAPILAISRLL